MKLAWKEIDAFVKKPNPKARAILIYGPDTGLVRERAGTIGKTVVTDLHDPFNVITLTSEQLADDPARLQDEAMAMSLMGGARLIRIENAGDKITTIFKEYLASPSADNLVILEAGELIPRSSLRLLFEKSDYGAALPCYVDDERAVIAIIKQSLSDSGLSIQSDAAVWMASNISGDRARVRAEIEKLIVYMGKSSSSVTLEDVRAACGEAGDQSLDDLIYALGSGRTETALKSYAKLVEEGTGTIQIMRTLQSHFRKLHYTHAMMKKGASIDEAMKKLQPAIFFKHTDTFKSQVKKWPEDRLIGILARLSQVEAQMKQTGTPSVTLGSQVILSLAA